jgi:hypothetical protein
MFPYVAGCAPFAARSPRVNLSLKARRTFCVAEG